MGTMGRRLATLLVCVSAARIVYIAHVHQPLTQWLLWPVLGYWAAALAFMTASFSLGTRLLSWFGTAVYQRSERLLLGLTLGVYAFSVMLFAIGLLHLSFAVALGLVVAALMIGGRAPFVLLADVVRSVAARMRSWAFQPLSLLVVPLSVLVLAAVYIPLLSLHNLQHDARWYHLPIAAQYVAQGRITPFAEGWILGTYPHLSSLLFTWALLFPVSVVHGIGIAAHMEFLLFVATLVAIPLMVRRASRDGRVGYAWAAFFLFPGFLVYDASVSLGADHIAAFWAPAILVVLFALWRRRRVGDALLLGLFAAAAACTKYSALCLVAPCAFAVLSLGLHGAIPVALRRRLDGMLARVAGYLAGEQASAGTHCASSSSQVVAARHSSRPALSLSRGALLVALCGLSFVVGWSPHWLKNLLWYGDPIYPVLHDYLTVHPWNPSTDQQFDEFNRVMVEHGPRTVAGLWEALLAAVSYGFETREFDFHGQRPVFGFLFAALLPVAPFVRIGRRGWSVLALCILGLMSWYLSYTRDRYLQAMLPWLVVFAAVTLRACWHRGSRALRAATVLLVAVQVVAGLDVFFLRSHVMARGHHPWTALFDSVTGGYRGGAHWEKPHAEWYMASWVAIGRQLPRGAKLLSHRERLWTGVGVPVVTDESRWQAGIDYDRSPSRGALLSRLRTLRVTHVLTGDTPASTEYGPLSVGGELRLWDLLRYAREMRPEKPFRLWELPKTLPTEPAGRVAVFTCRGRGVPAGVYTIEQLGLGPAGRQPQPLPTPTLKDVQSGASTPPFAVWLPGCTAVPPGYVRMQKFGLFELYALERSTEAK